MYICVKRDAERKYIHEINIYINFVSQRIEKERGFTSKQRYKSYIFLNNLSSIKEWLPTRWNSF